jgi:glycosyltransferase involved in cell wall biosynthesis
LDQESKTLIFIPALNEEESVEGVIRGVRAQLPEASLLVVDDGSTDGTAQRARAAGAPVAILPFNAGLGAALQTGYRYAAERGFEYFAHLDADGQHPPGELPRILRPIWADEADLIVGSRFAGDPEREAGFRSSPLRRFWIIVLGHLLSATSGGRFSDITSGFRAGNRRAIDLFAGLYQPDFGEIEALQSALKEGLTIDEVPVRMMARERGASYLTVMPSFLFLLKAIILIAIGRFRGAMR